MPQISFSVGDYITHTTLGNGIILNVFSRNGNPLYHIDFFTNKCRYIHGADVQCMILKRPSDEQTTRTAQNLLLEYFKEAQWNKSMRHSNEPIIGDIVYHSNFGNCLILGPNKNGYDYNHNQQTSNYHAYCIDSDTFAYISNPTYMWKIPKKSNPNLRQQVNKLWIDKILSQPG